MKIKKVVKQESTNVLVDLKEHSKIVEDISKTERRAMRITCLILIEESLIVRGLVKKKMSPE